jgi:hypothetical protein
VLRRRPVADAPATAMPAGAHPHTRAVGTPRAPRRESLGGGSRHLHGIRPREHIAAMSPPAGSFEGPPAPTVWPSVGCTDIDAGAAPEAGMGFAVKAPYRGDEGSVEHAEAQCPPEVASSFGSRGKLGDSPSQRTETAWIGQQPVDRLAHGHSNTDQLPTPDVQRHQRHAGPPGRADER